MKLMGMVNKGMFSLVILVSSFNVNAQSSEYYMGIKGGLNLSNVSGINGEVLPGFVGGIYAEYPLSEQMAIRSEILYSGQGSRLKYFSEDFNLNYINWPILARYYSWSAIGFETGPQIGFIINGSGGAIPSGAYKNVELGWVFGTFIPLSERLEVSARYNLGLTNIIDYSPQMKNSVFQFSLGILL